MGLQEPTNSPENGPRFVVFNQNMTEWGRGGGWRRARQRRKAFLRSFSWLRRMVSKIEAVNNGMSHWRSHLWQRGSSHQGRPRSELPPCRKQMCTQYTVDRRDADCKEKWATTATPCCKSHHLFLMNKTSRFLNFLRTFKLTLMNFWPHFSRMSYKNLAFFIFICYLFIYIFICLATNLKTCLERQPAMCCLSVKCGSAI